MADDFVAFCNRRYICRENRNTRAMRFGYRGADGLGVGGAEDDSVDVLSNKLGNLRLLPCNVRISTGQEYDRTNCRSFALHCVAHFDKEWVIGGQNRDANYCL